MNRVSLTLGLAAMDTCWAYPWCVLMGPWTDSARSAPLLSWATVFALVLIGAFSTQVLGRHASRSRRARVGIAGFSVLAALLAVRFDHYTTSGTLDWIVVLAGALIDAIGHPTGVVMAFAVALYLWWRGVRLGSQTASFTEVESAFRWGIGRLVAFGLVIAITTRPSVLRGVEAETTPFVVGFFFVSLVTLALGRLESLRTRTRTLSINSQWFGVLLLVAASVIVLALLLAQLVSFDVLLVATRPLFDLLGQILLLLVYVVVIPLAYVVEWLVYLVLSLVTENPNRRPPEPLQPADVNKLLERFIAEQVPPEVLLALKGIAAAALIGLGLLIVARALTRWRPTSGDADATNEERDSLWDAARVRALLLAWLRRLLRRERAAAPALGAGVPVAPTANTSGRQQSVRELYARLLQLGHEAGAPRAPATTPLEHAAALTSALEPARAVTDLTDAYISVRYADTQASPVEIDALRDQLGDVRPKSATE